LAADASVQTWRGRITAVIPASARAFLIPPVPNEGGVRSCTGARFCGLPYRRPEDGYLMPRLIAII
jgi:hypothetical protein